MSPISIRTPTVPINYSYIQVIYLYKLLLFWIQMISLQTPTVPTLYDIAQTLTIPTAEDIQQNPYCSNCRLHRYIRRYKFPQMPLSLIFLLFPPVHYFACDSVSSYTYDILCSLTYDQYSICGKTRGGSAMYFWLILTIFSGGQYKLGGLIWEEPDNPPTPRQIEHCIWRDTNCVTVYYYYH